MLTGDREGRKAPAFQVDGCPVSAKYSEAEINNRLECGLVPVLTLNLVWGTALSYITAQFEAIFPCELIHHCSIRILSCT